MKQADVERIKTNVRFLNESQLRKYLASEAISIGRGGITEVSAISGVHRNTISIGVKELKDPNYVFPDHINNTTRIRKEGGGRKSILTLYPDILDALERLVDPETYGNPENPLRWTTKSLRNLAEELQNEGYQIKHDKVGDLLKQLGYSLQQNQKLKQVGKQSPDRDGQFKHINSTAIRYLNDNQPVISIDCKKKENIGDFKNNGSEYRPTGTPIAVLDHDFPLPEKGKAAPYGVYDILNNEGYVNIGVTHDTAAFAVNSIRNWWYYMGCDRFPNVGRLYITADGGGSNGSRCKLWKVQLQGLSDELSIPIEVSHFPPGTSKWNKIEHRLFSQISKNWRGHPLDSLATIVSLISNTTTQTGLSVKCNIDWANYETGIRVTDEELSGLNITQNEFCGYWNYTVYPRGDMH